MSAHRLTIWQAFRLLTSSGDVRSRNRFVLLGIASLVISLLDLAAIVLLGLASTLMLTSMQETSQLGPGQEILSSLEIAPVWLACLALTLLVGKALLGLLVQARVERFARKRERSLAIGVFDDLLTVPVDRLNTLDGARVLTATSWWAEGISGAVISGFSACADLFLVLLMAVGLLIISPVAGGFTLTVLLIVFLASQVIFNRLNAAASRDLKMSYLRIFGTIADSQAVSRESRVYHLNEWFKSRLAAQYTAVIENGVKATLASRGPVAVYEPTIFVLLALAAFITFRTQSFAVGTGQMVIIALALSKIVSSIARAHSQITIANKMLGEASSAKPVIDEISNPDARLIANRSLARTSQTCVPEIKFSSVSYFYPGATTAALSNISLSIIPGSRVALVGSTGSGKTTLGDLALGLLKPTTGQVELICSHDQTEHTHNFAYVPQDVQLIGDTARVNILLDQSAILQDDQLAELLESVEALEFVSELPNGFDTLLGSGGNGLSGGEKQRLGLARALSRGARVLVLDEATSALDGVTERAVSQAIAHLRGDTTVIVIAHRLSTVIDADQVVLLDRGLLVDYGTFSELVTRNADFANQAGLQGLSSNDIGRGTGT